MTGKGSICIVSSALKMGGMERAAVNFANAIELKGIKLSFISIFNQTHFYKLNSNIEYFEPKNYNTTRLSLLKTIFWLRKSIKNIRPECVIVFGKYYSAIVMLSLCGTGIRVFITERSSPFYRWKFPHRLFMRVVFYLLKPAGFISQTKIANEYQKRYYGKNIPSRIIPNALRDISRFEDIKKKNWVLAVGRLNDYLKGFDRLIEAWSLVNAPEWILVLAGGNLDDDPVLKRIITEKSLEKRILFLGKIQDIDKVYSESSVFVIPSRSEGYPNSLCEAMAHGLACIAFDFTAGPRDIIVDNHNGIIVENGNIEKMAHAIEILINDPEKRIFLGNNACDIINKLDKNMIANEVIEFIYAH